jgi:large conductance mechanosensitive channel
VNLENGKKGDSIMLQEFRDFIAKGNVMDMAVGIIIGAAFTAIVKSMVGDLINPIIGLFLGGVDFTNSYIVLSGEVAAGASLEAAREAGAAVFAHGAFIMAVINFLIIAFVVFMLVRYVNKVKEAAAKKEEEAPVEEAPKGPSELDVLLEIRDSLKK